MYTAVVSEANSSSGIARDLDKVSLIRTLPSVLSKMMNPMAGGVLHGSIMMENGKKFRYVQERVVQRFVTAQAAGSKRFGLATCCSARQVGMLEGGGVTGPGVAVAVAVIGKQMSGCSIELEGHWEVSIGMVVFGMTLVSPMLICNGKKSTVMSREFKL